MNSNVAIFILSLSKGGSEKQAILLANYLSNNYNTHLIVLSKSKDIHPVLFQTNVKPYYLTGNILNKVLSLYFFIKKEQITHLFNYLPSNNILGSLIGKAAGVNYIFGGIRGTKAKSPVKQYLMKYVFNNICTKVISNSSAAKNIYVTNGIKADKIIVINNGIEILSNKALIKSEKSVINILSVGRFIEEKDFITAIESIALLSKKFYPDNYVIRYNIVGYGQLLDKLRQKIDSLSLASIISLQNEIDNINNFYQDADIYLSTSTHEGMSNTIMEALSHSLPVVCTDVGDSSYLVIDGFNGFLCKPKDSTQISDSLFRLIKDKDLRLKMAKNAYAHITSNYSVEKSFAKYDLLIKEYA